MMSFPRLFAMGKTPPSNDQNAASSGLPAKQNNMESEVVNRDGLICFDFADNSSPHPIIGRGLIGALNVPNVPKKDIFIQAKYCSKIAESYKAKIYQEDSPSDPDTGKTMRVLAVDTVDIANSFRHIRNCFTDRTDGLQEKVKFSWFIDEYNNLLYNLHLSKETVLWENLESLEKEANTESLDNITFYGELITAVCPELESQIFEQIELVYHNWEDKLKEREGPDDIDDEPLPHRTVADGNLIDLDDLYFELKRSRPNVPSYKLRLDSLACNLREFQKDAVDFLIHREVEPAIDVGLLHTSIKMADNIFYFPSFGEFVRDSSETSVNVVGGILADETGLGKTLELLCLILSHQTADDTEELLKTRINMNIAIDDQILNYESDDSSLVNDFNGEKISHFRISTEETSMPENIKIANNFNSSEVSDKNAHLSSNTNTGDIHCNDCGERWSVRKVHWLPEFEKRNLIFNCPTCTAEGPKIPVSATLVVVPTLNVHQWYDEIRRHVTDDFKVDMYMGVEADGYKNAHYFSKFKLVITTYDVLQKEKEFIHGEEQSDVHRVCQQSCCLRKRSHSGERRVVSPLTCIDWWRVCLDEWQMVQSGDQREVCFQLQARAKWCISGTPLVQNFHEIQEILRFLRVRPFDSTRIWDSIYCGYLADKRLKPMVQILTPLFWRNSMNGVAGQLRLPENRKTVNNVFLSPFEMENYKLKFIDTKRKMADVLGEPHYFDEINVDPRVLQDAMNLLNSIRWSLFEHDQYLTEDPARASKNFSGETTHDVFDNLLNKTRNVLAKASRTVMENLNELAAHKMRTGHFDEAIDCYTEALSSRSKQLITSTPGYADVQLQMHSITNLIDAASKCPDRVSNDEIMTYKIQLKDLEERFNKVHTCKKLVSEAANNLAVAEELHAKNCDNFKKVLSSLQEGAEEALENLQKVLLLEKVFLNRQMQLDQFLSYFQPWAEIDLSVESKKFNDISNCPNRVECDVQGTSKKELHNSEDCSFCLLNASIRDIQQNLSTATMEKNNTTFGDAASSEARQANSRIASYYVTSRQTVPLENDPIYIAMKSVLQDSDERSLSPFEMFEQYMHSLMKCMVWVNNTVEIIELAVVKIDKIRNITSRTSYDASENGPHPSKTYHCRCMTITRDSQHSAVLHDDILTGRVESEKRNLMSVHGKMSYLETLLKNDMEKLECPVCYTFLETSWQMLPCFHSMCNWCYIQFTQQPAEAPTLECAICRAPFKLSEVDEVMMNRPSTSEFSAEPVNRYTLNGINLTFKMASIMRSVVSLLNENSANKIVVFSEMDSILEMISQIMKQLKIQHIITRSRNCDPRGIVVFKERTSIPVLLLPLCYGANGLNLVEANHVFFMEPTPNATVYQQARSRVVRMGQTRATTFHHLVTKDTIEETIHDISTDAYEIGFNDGTLRHIFGIY